ncbi:MAG: hypothetical protein ACLUD2_12580 [Clostridium sp.]
MPSPVQRSAAEAAAEVLTDQTVEALRMTADLIFDADLLANALILSKLQVENEAADAIADRWLSDMSGYDAVIGEDRKTFYSFKAYRDAVEQAKNAGTYLSFADYLAAGNAETTPNRPYAVKYVLEDNLLGGDTDEWQLPWKRGSCDSFDG